MLFLVNVTGTSGTIFGNYFVTKRLAIQWIQHYFEEYGSFKQREFL